MREFSYRVVGSAGLHARPIAALAAAVRRCDSTVTVACHGSSCDAGDLIGLMALDARRCDDLVFRIEGGDEAASEAAVRSVCTF